MKIKELKNTHGWKIEPQTSDEYKMIKPEIEALMKRFNNKNVLVAGSIWAEMPELSPVQFEAGWPPAEPPSHECGWSQAIPPHPTYHEKQGDFGNYLSDQYNKEPTDSDD